MRKNDCCIIIILTFIFYFTNTYYVVIIGRPRQGNDSSDVSSLTSLAYGIVVGRVCCLHKRDNSCCLWQKKTASLASVEKLVLSCLEEVHNLSREDTRDYLT